MGRMVFNKGELRQFIENVQVKLKLDCDGLAKVVGLSGRTIRDWRREKYYPQEDIILKFSKLSGIKVPSYHALPQYWNIVEAAKKGGKKRYELYGLLGNRESRVKGGLISWQRREKDPELFKKYTNTFNKPEFSAKLAEFIGIMLGDGGMSQNQFVIYLNKDTDRDFANYTQLLIKELFGLTPKIYESKKDRVIKVSISGINLIRYLTQLGLSIGNKVKLQATVPSWIWLKKEYIKTCIRGLMDTDGCFTLHRYTVNGKEYIYPKIAFTNRSKPILDFVYKGLTELGYNPKIPFRFQVWLHNQREVRQYLKDIGTNNYKPVVKKIIGGVA